LTIANQLHIYKRLNDVIVQMTLLTWKWALLQMRGKAREKDTFPMADAYIYYIYDIQVRMQNATYMETATTNMRLVVSAEDGPKTSVVSK